MRPMKLTISTFVLVALFVLGCKSPTSSQRQPIPDVRTEHRDETDKNGAIVASVETVYRGKVRVLDTVRYSVARGDYASGGWFRIYRVNGKPMLFEEDKNGNGTTERRLYP